MLWPAQRSLNSRPLLHVGGAIAVLATAMALSSPALASARVRASCPHVAVTNASLNADEALAAAKRLLPGIDIGESGSALVPRSRGSIKSRSKLLDRAP